MPRNVLNIDVCAMSNCGYAKEDNEDAVFVSEDRCVLAVADGMGGEPYGEVASALAVQAVEEMWRLEPPASLPEDEHMEWIERAFDHANEQIYRHSERDSRTYGMGTTLVAAIVTADGAVVGNIGDSRAILIDGKYLRTITRDHTAEPDPNRRRASNARKGGLTKRLGNDFSVTADVFTVSIPHRAWLLLCTDGLHGVVLPEEMISIAQSAENAEHLCELLIDSALEGGGPDNITVVAWRNVV